MARSLGDFRGVYSELESGRHCMTTPSRSVINKETEPLAAIPPTIVHSAYTIDEPSHENDLDSADQNSVVQVHEEVHEHRDIEIQSNKPTTFQILRGCIGNWVCLLLGLTVLAGSITMTVFGFLANDFSQTMTSAGNTTGKERDEDLYESLSSLKTYGPILTGCGCFIIMCACVLLCDARDKLRAVVETEDLKRDSEKLTYSDVLRRIYEDEIRRKDEEETKRRTQKIDEYFEYMSRHPVGRRTLIRAMRPRSLSDPCISCTRTDSPLPDAYEYAREKINTSPFRKRGNANNCQSQTTLSQEHHDISSSRPKSFTPRDIPNLSPAGQLLYLERTLPGTLPPIKCRSKNGPIRVDTSSLPVGSLEKLYLGDENISGDVKHQRQKKKKGKRKKGEAHRGTTQCDKPLPASALVDHERTNASPHAPSGLKSTQEMMKSSPHVQQIKLTTTGDQHELHRSDPNEGVSIAVNPSRDKVLTVASVTSELEPSIRTLKWVEESNEQPWNQGLAADSGYREKSSYETTVSKSDIRKSSTGSMSFDGSNALNLRHQAMVL